MWELALLERGVEIVDDDLGRPCVRREVLGNLLREDREHLARIAVESAARAAAAVAPVPAGIPALENGSAMASIMAGDPSYATPQAEFGARSRSSWTSCSREGSGTRLTFKRRPSPRKAARDR
jgi:hypothetical protein